MIDGPHIFGFSPVALCISLTSTLASARLVWSVSASMNAATLALVGLVLLSAIRRALPSFVGAHHYINHASRLHRFRSTGPPEATELLPDCRPLVLNRRIRRATSQHDAHTARASNQCDRVGAQDFRGGVQIHAAGLHRDAGQLADYLAKA